MSKIATNILSYLHKLAIDMDRKILKKSLQQKNCNKILVYVVFSRLKNLLFVYLSIKYEWFQ